MRRLLAALILLAAPAAMAQEVGDTHAFKIDVSLNPDTGALIASSSPSVTVQTKKGYSPGARTSTVFWVTASVVDDKIQVLLIGERARYITPREAPKQREWGPWQSEVPAYIGSPWREASLNYTGSKLQCWGDAFWCGQVWRMWIPVPVEVLQDLESGKNKEIRISISEKRRVDWRIPGDEVAAVVRALHEKLAETAVTRDSLESGEAS